jgi:transglutaminase-like putative cysteine protease
MRPRFRCALLAILLLAGAAPAEPPAHRIEAADAQKVSATITYELRTKEYAVSRWMVFLPEPPELPWQRGVKVKAATAGRVVAEKSLLARKVRFIDSSPRAPAPGAALAMRLEIEATLRSRKLVALKPGERPPPVAPLSANERKYYLAPTASVDFDSRSFQDWLDAKGLRRGKAETAADLARRALEVIRSDFTYRFNAREDKSASAACKDASTDCAGMAYLFVGAMRAGGTPARLTVGRLAQPRKPGSDPSQTEWDRPHVRTEFFVGGVGWVPVDPSYAHASKRKPAADFIGHDPGDMLVLHLDVDLQMPFPDKVRECQFLQIAPFYWALGQGKFDGSFGPSGWELKATPLKGRSQP